MNNKEFYEFNELEEVTVIELKEGEEVLGGITIIANSKWGYDEFHIRWDLFLTKEYSVSTNYANASEEWTEIVHQNDEKTVVVLHHEEHEHYKELKEAQGPQDWGWGEWYENEQTKIVIIKHNGLLEKIEGEIAFRRQFLGKLEELEKVFNIQEFDFDIEEAEEEIEDLEELIEIEELIKMETCEECKHPLGHLFEDQCPCGYRE